MGEYDGNTERRSSLYIVKFDHYYDIETLRTYTSPRRFSGVYKGNTEKVCRQAMMRDGKKHQIMRAADPPLRLRR
jgi:hypothetical protein